jgi:hypothetical protein
MHYEINIQLIERDGSYSAVKDSKRVTKLPTIEQARVMMGYLAEQAKAEPVPEPVTD